MYLRLPRQLHVELTNYCNANCPMCSRELNPIETLGQLSFNDMVFSFSKDQFDKINYCGNDGDPLMARDLLKIIKYFEGTNQLIHTNGSLRNDIFWKELASIKNIEVVFAIDGATADTHEKYRINTSFNKIINNAKTFIDAGGIASWQFIMFEHNQHELYAAKNIARDYGFKSFETLYSRREATINIIPIKSMEIKSSVKCKAKEREEIYVRSDGEVFPCVYQGERPNKSGLNIRKMPFKEIVFNNYFDTFGESNNICQSNCGSINRNYRVKEAIDRGL